MTSPTAVEPRTVYSSVQQDWATFRELAAETGRTLIEVVVAPGGGNALHTHKSYDEHFEVLEGGLTVQLGQVAHRLAPGDEAHAPAGALHCFRNETDAEARFLVELQPGHRGFEEALQVGYGLTNDGLTRPDGTPKSVLATALLLEWSDIGPTGPARLIVPVLRPLAALARRRGLDEELRARYCRF